jgi:hypothetical protein
MTGRVPYTLGVSMVWSVKRKRTLVVLAALGGLLVEKGARAQEALPAGWLESQQNERGQRCEKRATEQSPGRLLLACGASGVWEIALGGPGPRFVRSYEFPGDVIGFFTEPDGRLWVKLHVFEARPFISGGPAGAVVAAPGAAASPPGAAEFPEAGTLPPAAPGGAASGAAAPPALPSTPPSSPPSAHRTGNVVKSTPGEVVVSLGTRDGVGRSDHIELSIEHPEGGGVDDAALSREVLAIGVVTNVTERSAKVRLGVNESVPVGALANRTLAAATASQSAPPRVSDITTLEVTLRPFAALGELGGGFLLSGAIGHRFGHLHLWGTLDPLAVADVENHGSVKAANGAVMVSYDSQYFEMGLGLGAQTVNSVNFTVAPGSGLAVPQQLRLGPLDGLNLTVRTSIVLFHSEFDFGGMVAAAQFPVTRGYWLILGGGGGNVGYGYGEIGLRVLAGGNGLAGSTFLTVTAGGAAVFRSGTCDQFFTCTESAAFGGPMAGIGGEWRF